MCKLNYFYINPRKILGKQLSRMVYLAMTQSILQHGVTAWDGLGIVAFNKLLTAKKEHN